LQFIHGKIRPDHRGHLQSFSYDEAQYEVLPIELGQIQGQKIQFKIYSLPGNLDEKNIRQELAKDALGIVFVVDSQASKLGQNLQLYEEILELIQNCGKDPEKFPVILQYNKLDLPNAVPIDELQEKINSLNYPFFKSVANQGTGVLSTLTTISKAVIRYLRTGGDPLNSHEIRAPLVPKTPEPIASPARKDSTSLHSLVLQKTSPSMKNSDGSHGLVLYLKDPQSGDKFRAQIRLEMVFETSGLVMKILPEK